MYGSQCVCCIATAVHCVPAGRRASFFVFIKKCMLVVYKVQRVHYFHFARLPDRFTNKVCGQTTPRNSDVMSEYFA